VAAVFLSWPHNPAIRQRGEHLASPLTDLDDWGADDMAGTARSLRGLFERIISRSDFEGIDCAPKALAVRLYPSDEQCCSRLTSSKKKSPTQVPRWLWIFQTHASGSSAVSNGSFPIVVDSTARMIQTRPAYAGWRAGTLSAGFHANGEHNDVFGKTACSAERYFHT